MNLRTVGRRTVLKAAAGAGTLLAAALAACRPSPPSSPAPPVAGPGRLPTATSPTTPAATPAATAIATPAAPPTPVPPTATAAPPAPASTIEPTPARLPLWYGFNLQEKFNYDWGTRRFEERDFAWIEELGFNFVRLPMDYRAWSEPNDWNRLRQNVLEEIDDALLYGERYHLHVCINFHRAPGYTVSSPPEKFSLWKDEEAQRVCAMHWAYFARRYRHIPNERLSFNLLNEPPPATLVTPAQHRAVIMRLLEAIRQVDDRRLVICDGVDWGKAPPTELLGTRVAMATRGYDPMGLTHYGAEWITGADRWERPTHPFHDGTTLWNTATLRQQRVEPWRRVQAQGHGIHVGEFGVYNRTPHHVALAWMRECLQLWQEAGWGWALWNFRGPFGIFDSGRTDVAYEWWRGHRLDRAMLELLQRFARR